MPQVIVVGEALVEIMRPDSSAPLDRPGLFHGPFASGAPAIFAVAAARLGLAVGFAGAVGSDGFGRLPTQLAALNMQHMAFHDLVTTAVLEQDREAAVHALMLDPLTAAVCSLEEIRQMFDEMAKAQVDYLPEFING